MPDLLLATCAEFPDGEPGREALDAALGARGATSAWARWDDPAVDWAAAGLVAVRSTWDYVERLEAFLGWAAAVGPRMLNGAETFRWNTDKGYLLDLAAAGLAVVPTVAADSEEQVVRAVAGLGVAVVKPRVGVNGDGVQVVTAGESFVPDRAGPWIVQPLVDSVRTSGETSVFVFDGVPTSQVDKRPAPGEIRVHEHRGGTSTPASLEAPAARRAEEAVVACGSVLGEQPAYARVDLMRGGDGWWVSEVELTEPGLYLDVLPGNAAPFADLVVARLGG
jgi:glutathione synthase/RimK-type ligase-like ATP-grasp enzyme